MYSGRRMFTGESCTSGAAVVQTHCLLQLEGGLVPAAG
jgi:hypothetical protein